MSAYDVNPDHTPVTVEGPVALLGRTKEIADYMAIRYMGQTAQLTQRKRRGEWHPCYIVTVDEPDKAKS